MTGDKIRTFITLAGQELAESLNEGSAEQRRLGAQLLLSEVLEYVIDGLGVIPEVDGTPITEPDKLHYRTSDRPVSQLEMVDGLADVAYTMYWNAETFGVPLEEAFTLVCDNNLEKFVELGDATSATGRIERDQWHCNCDVTWPEDVVQVEIVQAQQRYFAVGKDKSGKVRKPSSYQTVDLTPLLSR